MLLLKKFKPTLTKKIKIILLTMSVLGQNVQLNIMKILLSLAILTFDLKAEKVLFFQI